MGWQGECHHPWVQTRIKRVMTTTTDRVVCMRRCAGVRGSWGASSPGIGWSGATPNRPGGQAGTKHIVGTGQGGGARGHPGRGAGACVATS